jgi:hypothetical protein
LGLGDILGSISPVFGMASGKGMFGKLPLQQLGQSGVGGLLGMLLSHGSDQGGGVHQAPVDMGVSQPATLSTAAPQLPGMSASPSVGQALGSAMGGGAFVKPSGSGWARRLNRRCTVPASCKASWAIRVRKLAR